MLCYLRWFHFVAQAGLEITVQCRFHLELTPILLSQPLKCQHPGCDPLSSAQILLNGLCFPLIFLNSKIRFTRIGLTHLKFEAQGLLMCVKLGTLCHQQPCRKPCSLATMPALALSLLTIDSLGSVQFPLKDCCQTTGNPSQLLLN